MHRYSARSGWIEVVCGPMFSGKTEELIRRLRLVQIARVRYQIFKPGLDDRYADEFITSHNKQRFVCTPVKNSAGIMEQIKDDTRVVGIDEAQFFDEGIVQVCTKLANRGLRVIVAGLDQDYRGQPFGPMPHLLSIAEQVTKSPAVCMICGEAASKTQRITPEASQIVVGSGEHYQARCRSCYDPDQFVEKNIPKVPISHDIKKEIKRELQLKELQLVETLHEVE